MTSVPLQYDSLRTVIQYLDPNLRFKMSQHISSVRLVEKAVRLKIEALQFSDFDGYELTVNDTKYQLGVYRDYPGKVPRIHQDFNQRGGQLEDVDQFGFNDNSGRNTVLLGDVVLPRPDEGDYMDFNDNQKFYEWHVDFFQKAVAERLEKGEKLMELPETGRLPPGVDTSIYLRPSVNAFENPEDQLIAERENFEKLRQFSIGFLQYNVQSNQERLQRFYCRRDNTSPMFTPKIQLTITSPAKIEIHRFNYTMKLHEAMKNFCTQLFGARRYAISVNTLDTVCTKIIRLPVGLKIRIRKLKIWESVAENYESLKKIIDESSYPLDTLTGRFLRQDCDHHTLQSARELNIHGRVAGSRNVLQMFLILRNPVIHMETNLLAFPITDQMRLIQDWLQIGSPVGSTLSYDMFEDGVASELLNQIQEQNPNSIVHDLSAIIPMSSNCQLLISCSEENASIGYGPLRTQCTVVLKVEGAE